MLITKVVIPKMFENEGVPSELKGRNIKEKLNLYILNHPEKKYVLNIKNLKTNTNCIELLNHALSKISLETTGADNIFKINIIEQ